jgi:hypothetical protein
LVADCREAIAPPIAGGDPPVQRGASGLLRRQAN